MQNISLTDAQGKRQASGSLLYNIGVFQGSALDPLLFYIIVN